jgi:alkylation response protein AidB-like acyl-CoA dehydrogenase
MDIQLTDEQNWLADSVGQLLTRSGGGQDAALWERLIDFGALDIGVDGMGFVELAIVARRLGEHLATTPFIATASTRFVFSRLADELPDAFRRYLDSSDGCALAFLDRQSLWLPEASSARVERTPGGFRVQASKTSVELPGDTSQLLVLAELDGEPALALLELERASVTRSRSFAETVPLARIEIDSDVDAERVLTGAAATTAVAGVSAASGLLAAADAVGASASLFGLARDYAAERRQFGHAIGSFQALRHLLADMFVWQECAWSTVLYAAAGQDDSGEEDPFELATIAKAYTSRATVDVVHGALQVFGGVAFTAEHPAHLYQRRVIVRSRQFGDADYHHEQLARRLVTV